MPLIKWKRMVDGTVKVDVEPQLATDQAVGFDLKAAIPESMLFPPHSPRKVPTGVAIEMPEGLEAQVRPRSGLSVRGLWAAFGTIDPDYRGQIQVILLNVTSDVAAVEPGMRVAQLVFAPRMSGARRRIRWQQVKNLGATARGDGGFGSTGA